jgi:hypothetical protein
VTGRGAGGAQRKSIPAEPRAIDLAPVTLREAERRTDRVASALYTALFLVIVFGTLYAGDAVIGLLEAIK